VGGWLHTPWWPGAGGVGGGGWGGGGGGGGGVYYGYRRAKANPLTASKVQPQP
jgi:hypothetical protein